jgi:hypothetical protein
MFSDISKISDSGDFLPILTAVLIVEIIIIFIAKKSTLFGVQLNVWYEKLGMTAVLMDVLISIIGIFITRYIFSYYQIPFNFKYFILISVIVQIIHDILFYYFIILPSVKGDSLIMDIYLDYTKENGAYILLADACMIIGSCLIAMLLKGQETHVNLSISVLVLYLLPYYVYMKPIAN